ncbi:MAG: hypothetical protein KDD45_02965 [Bdellovibrionales bacterium]|nr:hypothetical protein [Bdellovibrionales bacterium]
MANSLDLLKKDDSKDRKRAQGESSFLLNNPEKGEQNLFETKDLLTNQLFGAARYRYKLIVDGDFQECLYKERNFNLKVKLVEVSSGKEQLNGNIVNVCLGVCDDNGEWIHETKEGVSFVKGKIEAELYHGSTSFVKMACRDVSRSFVNKTVNLVVYPKPTVLKYSGESSIEEYIDYSLIEPLIIHGVSIKAKKRE